MAVGKILLHLSFLQTILVFDGLNLLLYLTYFHLGDRTLVLAAGPLLRDARNGLHQSYLFHDVIFY